jgi:uncharacterized protein
VTEEIVVKGSPKVGDDASLRASHCLSCGRWEFPYRDYCPGCGSQSVSDGALSSRARVIGTTAVLHQPPGALVEAPYTVALAAFPEGVSVLGLVQDVPFEDVPIDAEVVATVVELGGRLGYQYRLAPPE